MRFAVVTLALVLAASGALPSHSLAASLEKGTLEVEGSVSFDHTSYSVSSQSQGTATDFAATLGGGYCLTRLIEVGGGLTMTHDAIEPEGGESISYSSYGGSVDVTLNFSTPNNLVPFVRVGAGFQSFSGDGSEDAKMALIAPYVRAGVRVLVGNSGSVNLSAAFRHEINSGGVEDLNANGLSFAVGVSLFPIRGK